MNTPLSYATGTQQSDMPECEQAVMTADSLWSDRCRDQPRHKMPLVEIPHLDNIPSLSLAHWRKTSSSHGLA